MLQCINLNISHCAVSQKQYWYTVTSATHKNHKGGPGFIRLRQWRCSVADSATVSTGAFLAPSIKCLGMSCTGRGMLWHGGWHCSTWYGPLWVHELLLISWYRWTLCPKGSEASGAWEGWEWVVGFHAAFLWWLVNPLVVKLVCGHSHWHILTLVW